MTASIVSAWVLMMSLALYATVAVAQPRVHEFKCESCDYSTRSWVRSTAYLDLKCAGTDDPALFAILRADVVGFDQSKMCEDERVSLDAVDALGATLCRDFVHHYPHVKEATHEVAHDAHHDEHEALFDDHAEYFDEEPDETVPTMTEGHMHSLRATCTHYLHLGTGHLRRVYAAAVRNAVLAQQLPAATMKVRTVEAASIERFAADGGDESVERFVKNRKRHMVYEAVLAVQRQLCFESCEGDVERPLRERRVRGWSATKRRL